MPRLQNFETQWTGAGHAHREEIEGTLLEGEVANGAHAHLPHPDIKDMLPSSKVLLIWTFSHESHTFAQGPGPLLVGVVNEQSVLPR